jgi:hypothetical protein
MDKSFARGTVEEADCLTTRFVCGLGTDGLFEGGAECRALRTVAYRGRARLPHVLLGGLDIRQKRISGKGDEAVRFWRRKPKGGGSRMSRRDMALTSFHDPRTLRAVRHFHLAAIES